MEGSDNMMLILNSITPIKYTYSKQNRELNKIFKKISLESLKKNLNCRVKIKDEFSPSPEFLKDKNKFEINFKNSYAYIKELSDINNLPLFTNNKNNIKKDSFNSDFDFNLNHKEEKKKIIVEKEKKNEDIFSERLRKLKNYKHYEPDTDSLRYNPNYDYIKKKIFCVYIRPPTSNVNIRQNNNKNKENEKYEHQKKKNSTNIFKEYVLSHMKNKNRNNIKLDKNKKEKNNIVLNNNNQNINNNSIVIHKFYTINSNTSKNQFIDNLNLPFSSRNYMKFNGKLTNLKNLFNKNNEYKNSLIHSDCGTIEINKSTNVENNSIIFYDKKKFYNSNSLKNIFNNNKILPKIKNLHKKNILNDKSERNNEIKHSIYFKKMSGRKDINLGGNSNNSISYSPNYEFFRPHIQSSIFSYKINNEDYKRYKTGKIIRGFKCSQDKYFVCEFKRKEPIKYNLNRERKKILEILRKKIE